ncbi:MAG: NEW3 domain-containing protein [Planctomycetota bacterium]|nr:NEW3 domain-containing protein [Planctomycetota bacterium]
MRFALLLSLLLLSPEDSSDDPIRKGALSKEGQSMLLTLKESLLRVEQSFYSLKKAESDLALTLELLDDGIYTNQDREVVRTQKAFDDASYQMDKSKIDFDKRKLEFFQDAAHITIVSAIKSSTVDDKRLVDILLQNTSDLDLVLLSEHLAHELVKDLGARLSQKGEVPEGVLPDPSLHTEDELIALLRIENIYVSLLKGGVNIGRPYERKIPRLRHHQEIEIGFEIQQDVDDLAVSFDFLKKQISRNIFLQTESKEDVVTVTSQQFAQEGELGTQVSFDLSLERLSEGERQFELVTIGLPEKYHTRFIEDQRRRAAIRRVKFTRRLHRQNLSLEVDIPKELPAEELLKPIKFFALVADSAGMRAIRPYRRGKELPTPAFLMEAKVGFEELELVPRGVGEMELTAPSQGYYYRTKPEEDVRIRFFLENTGTSALADVRFEINSPSPAWNISLDPEKVDWIKPGQKKEITLTLTSDEPMEIGEYSVKIEATCELSGKPILAEQNFRVNVQGQTDVVLAAIIMGVLLLIIVGIAVVGIRISRR